MRPRSIAEIAQRAQAKAAAFDPSVREFLDEWSGMTGAQRNSALESEPGKLTVLKDAYLAALTEHLAHLGGIAVPAWTDDPGRFLSEPYFAGGLESLKAILLAESPLAFRRRLIFISADGLSRPSRSAAE